MAMTQADFAEIADAVAEVKRHVSYMYLPDNPTPAQHAAHTAATHTLEQITRELATACARRYKGAYGFNRSKFVEACGFPDA